MDGFRMDDLDGADSLTGGWISMDTLTRRESDAEGTGPLIPGKVAPEAAPEAAPEVEPEAVT